MFTLEEARALLPRLRDLLARLIAASEQAQPLRNSLQAIQRATAGNGHVPDDRVAERRRELERLGALIEGAVNELQELGIELKDLARGLVDFPSLREGEVIYLCWMNGEDDIEYWHDLDSGFAGRRPL